MNASMASTRSTAISIKREVITTNSAWALVRLVIRIAVRMTSRTPIPAGRGIASTPATTATAMAPVEQEDRVPPPSHQGQRQARDMPAQRQPHDARPAPRADEDTSSRRILDGRSVQGDQDAIDDAGGEAGVDCHAQSRDHEQDPPVVGKQARPGERQSDGGNCEPDGRAQEDAITLAPTTVVRDPPYRRAVRLRDDRPDGPGQVLAELTDKEQPSESTAGRSAWRNDSTFLQMGQLENAAINENPKLAMTGRRPTFSRASPNSDRWTHMVLPARPQEPTTAAMAMKRTAIRRLCIGALKPIRPHVVDTP